MGKHRKGGCLVWIVGGLLVVAGILLSGCGEDTHKSAPDVECTASLDKPNPCRPGTKVEVVQNPDGFRNVLIECYGTTGLYLTSRGDTDGSTPVGSDLEIYPNDPRCLSATPSPTLG